MPPLMCCFGTLDQYSDYFKEAKSIVNSIVTVIERCLDQLAFLNPSKLKLTKTGGYVMLQGE
jgi:hypothetical protein